MLNFTSLKKNPRWLALIASAVIAALTGFALIPPDRALWVMTYGGYWVMLLLTGGWAWSLWRAWRGDFAAWRRKRHRPGWPLVIVGLGWLVLLVHEPFGFKILMDEAMLAGTAMSMHFDKLALVPMRAHDIQGAFELLGGQLDKRPLFQPFIVSLLHDFTGYRVENAFALNAGLSLLLLVLIHRAGRRMGGQPAGLVAVVLLAGVPLLAQNATGGGFELLNLVMILAVFLLGVRWAERRDATSLDALVMTTVLLAGTRYESVLFILPVAGLILWGWWREQRVVLGWTSALSPLFLIPHALHQKVFTLRESSWELGSQPGHETVFSLSYVPENILHALRFFFDTTGEQSNSLVLALLGVVAVPFFLLWLLKLLRPAVRAKPEEAALVALAVGLLMHAGLMMCYFWGRFDDPVIRRLSLPLHLLLVIAVVMVATKMPGGRGKWWFVAGVSVFGLFAYSLPTMARHDYSMDYYVARETAWRREFIAAHPEKDYLVIDPNSIEWIIHEVSSTPTRRAVEEPDLLDFNLRNEIFSAIFVFQRLEIDPATGTPNLPAEFDLGPAYELATVWERRFTPFTLSRISRVVTINPGAPAAPASTEVPDLAELSPEEREAVRNAYFENFIKQLP